MAATVQATVVLRSTVRTVPTLASRRFAQTWARGVHHQRWLSTNNDAAQLHSGSVGRGTNKLQTNTIHYKLYSRVKSPRILRKLILPSYRALSCDIVGGPDIDSECVRVANVIAKWTFMQHGMGKRMCSTSSSTSTTNPTSTMNH